MDGSQTGLSRVCLSGTAEMGLAGLVAGRVFHPSELPLRLAAVSRCYRAETSNVADEKGIYRYLYSSPLSSVSVSSHLSQLPTNQFC